MQEIVLDGISPIICPNMKSISSENLCVRNFSSTSIYSHTSLTPSGSKPDLLLLGDSLVLNSHEKQLLLHLTPKQYVELEKMRKKMNDSNKSLATLAQDVMGNKISEEKFTKVRETSHYSHANISMRRTTLESRSKITDSYLNLLQHLNENKISLKYNGDIASLALEAGNLNNDELQMKYLKIEKNNVNDKTYSSTTITSITM